MRIPSGKTDQNIFFVAIDSTDLSRKTGLSSFTVYRSRNGGTATIYTTPTVAELSSANMPGVYSLLIDEDTTIDVASDSEEYCVHITCSGMVAITRAIELYRAGSAGLTASDIADEVETRTIAAVTTVNGLAANVVTASALASDAVAEIQSGLSTLTAAGVRTAVGLGSANLDTQLGDLPTNAELATALAGADDLTLAAIAALPAPDNSSIAAIKAKTDGLTFVSGSVNANVKRVNDIAVNGAGTTDDPWGP